MDDLVKAVLAFRDERDWRQFHNARKYDTLDS